MSIFAHYVARCTFAHLRAVRAARDGLPHREVTALTVTFIGRLHRLETIAAEMGAGAVFGTPPAALGMDEVKRLLPDDDDDNG